MNEIIGGRATVWRIARIGSSKNTHTLRELIVLFVSLPDDSQPLDGKIVNNKKRIEFREEYRSKRIYIKYIYRCLRKFAVHHKQ